MEMRRLFIVYHSPLFAQGLRGLLSDVPGLEVVGMALARPEEKRAWKNIRRLAPDVVILEDGDQR